MVRRVVLCSVLLLGLSSGGSSSGDQPSKFDYSDRALIAFSSNEVTDEIRVSVAGSNCEDAVFRFAVYSGDRALYRYEKRYAGHKVNACLEGRAREFVRHTLKNAASGSSSELPPIPPPGEEMSYGRRVLVPSSTYERLKAANLPVLRHRTATEDWQELVYDATTTKAVVLLESGAWH